MSEEVKSEFQVEVVRLGAIEKHPNADSLSITSVNGYPCILKTGAFKEGDLAVYVPVDALVPTSRPEFSFLKKGDAERHRVKAIRLRGVFSMGLLVSPADLTWVVGQNVQEALDIHKWLSPSERALETHAGRLQAQKAAKANSAKWMPIYGLDALRKFEDVLVEGEEVVVTEKIHGCNARFCFKGGHLYVGSHRTLRGVSRHRLFELLTRVKLKVMDFFGVGHRADVVRDAGDVWWECAEKYDLKAKLSKHPGLVLYGEIYGEKVQDLQYDAGGIVPRKFRAFDVYDVAAGRYYDWDEFMAFCRELEIPTVPIVYTGPWYPTLRLMAEGDSLLNQFHIREGIVVKTRKERFDIRTGRVALKFASETYLLRKDAA